MKVLLYTHNYPPSQGGIATYSQELYVGLLQAGVDVVLLAPIVPGTDFPQGHQVYPLPMRLNHDHISLAGYLSAASIFKRVMFLEQPDTVLCCNVDAIYTMLFTRQNKSALVLTIHGSEIIRNFPSRSFSQKIRAYILKNIFQRAQKIIAVSNYTRANIIRLVPLEVSHKITAVYNGTNLSVSPLPKDNFDDGLIKFLSVGRLVEFKGFHLFPEILARLCSVYGNIIWDIAGEGPMYDRLLQDIQRLNIEQHVRFLGHVPRDEIVSLYQEHDLLIHPATIDQYGGSESFGLVLIEAMICGCPIVAAANGGISEIVEHMENGVLCDMKDTAQAADIISQLLADRPQMRDLALQAKKTAKEKFSRESVTLATLKVLEDALITLKSKM